MPQESSQPPYQWLQRVPTSCAAPVKHIYVSQQHQSIKGNYSISPHSQDAYPPKYDLPRAEVVDQSSSSAMFEATTSPINVTVWVHGDNDKYSSAGGHHLRRLAEESRTEPVVVRAKTTTGHLKIEVPHYICPHPLVVRAKSTSGQVHLYLPPTFSGQLSWQSEASTPGANGGLKLSRAIRQRYTPVVSGQHKHKHRSLGHIAPAEWVSGCDSQDDFAEVITSHGSLHVYDASEDDGSSKPCVIA